MFFFPELWREIKSFLFHNIKIHGKHLVKHKYNQTYNIVMCELKNKYKKYIPMGGPKILYTSKNRYFHCIKFYYGIPNPSCYSKNTNIYSPNTSFNKSVYSIGKWEKSIRGSYRIFYF